MSLENIRRLSDSKIMVSFPNDEDGFVGRECPEASCLGYFKIQLGTGLKGENLPCHCPYCGFSAGPENFFTQEQLEYAKSVALREVSEALFKDLESSFEGHEVKPRGPLGIGVKFTVEGKLQPLKYYRERQLETEVICEHCTLRYAIYGVFAFCPDCGERNSLQILEKNLDLCLKEVELAEQSSDPALAAHLIPNALEDAVSAFDGFGREVCSVYADRIADASKTKQLSFQNLLGVRDSIRMRWGFDLSASLTPDEWQFACRCFQKRHLLAHKMGIVDEAYLKNAADPTATVGRKISITPEDVRSLVAILRRLGTALSNGLRSSP
jgi:hypothetical protein